MWRMQCDMRQHIAECNFQEDVHRGKNLRQAIKMFKDKIRIE